MTVLAPNAAGLQRFRNLVERELGLRFDDAGLQNLQRALVRRLGTRHQACDEYLDQFAADPDQEILALTADLTVGETYFLRHVEQFQALTRTALPDLLQTPGRTGPLRLLSAGCSTGEETYSLAIALRESGIGADASILGVDANPVSLAKARTGRYTDWSLRSVPMVTRQRWFAAKGEAVVLDPTIRAAVRFEHHNIAQDDPALWQPAAFDVIFCRNVIMYFTPEVMAEVVGRISSSLIPGGYLFLGSAETVRGLSDDFEVQESHGTFYYRRRGGVNQSMCRSVPRSLGVAPSPAAAPSPGPVAVPNLVASRLGSAPVPVAAPTDVAEPESGQSLAAVLELLRRERFADALAAMDELDSVASDPELLLLRAALLTHSGHLPAAERACHQLLEIDVRSAGAHVLLAMCREGEQDLPAAVDHCRTAITFDPDFAMPHVHLGRMARRMGDRGTAQRQYAQSTRLLPAETGLRILLFGGGFDREALIAQCRTQAAAVREER
jgi:chemotaxis protein methyltransferase CheR